MSVNAQGSAAFIQKDIISMQMVFKKNKIEKI